MKINLVEHISVFWHLHYQIRYIFSRKALFQIFTVKFIDTGSQGFMIFYINYSLRYLSFVFKM